MTNAQFEMMTSLQYDNRALKRRVKALESGDKFVSMKAEHNRQLAEKDREIQALKRKLADANRDRVTSCKNWMQALDDLHKEHGKEMRAKDARNKQLFERSIKAESRNDKLQDELRELRKELYAVKTELEEEKGKRSRLAIQLKRDHKNSSVPSSQKPNRKKIANSRVKTGKRQGAQPGHKGHGRKRQEPTEVIEIKAPEYEGNPDYKPTGKIIRKQLVNIRVSLAVDEYWTKQYRHVHTKQRVHADFPESVVNDVNYGGSVKAFAFIVNNNCFVSIDKTRELISELTGGKLEISRGMINGLSKEFADKTRQEQADIFEKLLSGDIMGTDFSGAKVNGKQFQVLVCANEEANMFYAKEHKGHKGVKDTPVEHFQGTLVHDHDKTFYSYGKLHQECLVHILRYLISSMENEPGLAWNKLMWELIREMIHYRNGLDPSEDADHDVSQRFEAAYLETLATAKKEYEYEPPSKYYMDGYNLYRRLEEFKDSHLLFLTDGRVPSNNNLCERLLRQFKRKLRQMMTFRSFESLEFFCTSLGLLWMLRNREENLYSKVTEIFG